MTVATKMMIPASLVKVAKKLLDSEITDITSDISGPWDNEPEKAMIEHAGYVCELVRNPSLGFWCGYVYVGNEHPLFKHVDQDNTYDYINVHGGVTHKHDGKFGFDCGHAGDLSPYMGLPGTMTEVYRTYEFALNELKGLAQQLRNYDTAYHRRMFDTAKELDKRANAIRKALMKGK